MPLVTTTGNQLVSVATEIKAGQTVLVAGAFGGVGRSAAFTAKELGARVIAGMLAEGDSVGLIVGLTRSWNCSSLGKPIG